MSDTERRLDDIEKRLIRVERATALLERAAEKPVWINANGKPSMQWCECGRDICRAPDCPTHKAEPLGR